MTKTIQSLNPATLDTIAELPITTDEQVYEAVARARTAAPQWAALTYKDRAKYVIEFREVMKKQLEELAHLISQENGKPLTESLSSDLVPVMELATHFAKHTEKTLRRERIWLGKWDLMGRSSYIDYKPLGVVGIIAPWNYPFSIPTGQTLMAVMAGNTVVLKPSEYTPVIGEKIAALAREAGFPEGVIQVVTGDGSTGAALLESDVNKIFFTGSVNTGKKIMAAAAKNLTPVSLELGGKDPMIVLEDADVDVASSAAVWGAFSNNGQICASVERLYVHESIADVFIEQVVEKTLQLKQAEGSDYDADVSVLNNETQLRVVTEHVDGALKAGAIARTGGARLEGQPGYFYPPTVLTGVRPDMKIVTEETFGPVLPVMRFQSEAEAIAQANDSNYGLTASVWSKDRKRAERVAKQLHAGTATVNENVYTYALPQTPWGGPKWSGIGRTHGKHGLLEMVEPQHIHINKVGFMKDLWWYSYDQTRFSFLLAMTDAFFAKGLFGKVKGFGRMLGLMRKLKTH